MAGVTTATQPDLRQLRVDHTGGLRKPERLLDVYRRNARGEATDAEVERLQGERGRELIATQVAHGPPILSDGEYRRRQFQESFGEAVEGFDADPGSVYAPASSREETPTRRVESEPTSRGPAVLHRRPVTQRLELVRNVPLDEYRRASPLTDRLLKVTLVGPGESDHADALTNEHASIGIIHQCLLRISSGLIEEPVGNSSHALP
jgi:5-methyltetrahydropteroyltriglutamate--homocysteine methyltransferase